MYQRSYIQECLPSTKTNKQTIKPKNININIFFYTTIQRGNVVPQRRGLGGTIGSPTKLIEYFS